VYRAAGEIEFDEDDHDHTKPHQKQGVPKSNSAPLLPDGPSDIGASTALTSL